MTTSQLQALLEFKEGEFHDFQCRRSEAKRPHRHSEMSKSQDWLIDAGLIKLIGDEYFLTEDGKDIIATCLRHASKLIR